MKILIRASLLDAPERSRLRAVPDGHVAVGDDGAIASSGPWDRRPEGGFDAVVELPDAVLIPGFVDAHAHLPQAGVRGRAKGDLLDWLRDVAFPAEEAFADARLARREARSLYHELQRLGTVAAGLYLPVQEESARVALEEAAAAGFGGALGKVMMDREVPDALCETTEEALASSARLAREFGGAGGGAIRYAYTPRFAVSCTPALLRGAGRDAASAGAAVQTHLSESPREIARVRELFPEAANYADVYADAGLLGPRTLLAHCIHLSDTEWARVATAGAAVVHCPTSNRALGSGRFPVERAPVTVPLALGTDVGAGPSLSMRSVLAGASRIHPPGAIPATALLHAATMGGAAAVGAGARLGTLEAGKEATFQAYAKGAPPEAWDAQRWVARFVRDDGPAPGRVWVRGRRVG